MHARAPFPSRPHLRAGGRISIALVLMGLMAALPVARASAAATAATPAYDSQWLQMSIAGDRFEIQAAKLAIKRSHNGHLGALAGRLLSDHTKSLKKATALAQRLNVRVTPAPLPTMQWSLRALQAMPQERFATEYVKLEIGDHNQAIVDAGREVENGQDNSVKAFADAASTMLAKHVRLARQTLRSLQNA